MNERDASLRVFLRDVIAFKKGATIAYRNGVTSNSHPLDDALVHCLLDGCNDLDSLTRAMESRGYPGSVDDWARRIRDVARVSSSAVRSRHEPSRVPPELIVVHLAPRPGEVDGAAIARAMAKEGPVWFVTNKAVRPTDAGSATSCHAKQAASTFEFLQWVRGLPVRFPQVPVLLCGEADAICFGGAAARGNVLIAVSDGWPGRAGAFQVWPGSVHEPGEPQIVEEALYAVSSAQQDPELNCLRRGSSSSLGMLEAWALLGASKLLYRTRSQGEAMMGLGIERERLGILARYESRDRHRDVRRSGLLVLASAHGELCQLLPVAELAARIVGTGAFSFAALLSDDAWFRVGVADDRVSILPWSGAPPDLTEFLAALGIAARLDDFQALADSVVAGCKLHLVPGATEEPLLVDVPRQVWLEGGPQEWVQQMSRVASSGGDCPNLREFGERCRLAHWLRAAMPSKPNAQVLR